MSKKKKSKSTTWADVSKGQTVELRGFEWVVRKYKPAGKTVKLRVERDGREVKAEVRLKDPVKIVAAPTPPPRKSSKREPLHEPSGGQSRWATQKELDAAMSRGLPKGDPSITEPPTPAAGDLWETQADRTEKMLGKVLGATLVGVSRDEAQGYSVPPVGVATVAAHLMLFHGGIPSACDDDEGAMLKAHAAQHDAAKKGEGILEVNHWHEDRRP